MSPRWVHARCEESHRDDVDLRILQPHVGDRYGTPTAGDSGSRALCARTTKAGPLSRVTSRVCSCDVPPLVPRFGQVDSAGLARPFPYEAFSAALAPDGRGHRVSLRWLGVLQEAGRARITLCKMRDHDAKPSSVSVMRALIAPSAPSPTWIEPTAEVHQAGTALRSPDRILLTTRLRVRLPARER